tara:strand:+ start:198 stop:683 length:486 start_codon:yes stop_codon:yes gene_type:complete
MKKTLTTFIISIFLMNNSSFSQISTEFQLKEASKTAVIWLNNLNSEYTNQSGETYNNYPQAYTDLSILITSKFDSLDWISGVELLMVEFGEFGGRREISREFKNSMEEFPGMEGFPNGYYAIFQYESNYKNTLQHSEQLILHQDDKRRWKILDYSYEFKEE